MYEIALFIILVIVSITIGWWIDTTILTKLKWWRWLKNSEYENKLEELKVIRDE